MEFTFFLKTSDIWIQYYPLSNSFSLQNQLQEGQYFNRISTSGTLDFCDSEYDVLISLLENYANNIPIRIYQYGVLQTEGAINLQNSIDYDRHIISCTVKIMDIYQPILDNYSTVYNIYNVSPISFTQVYNIGGADKTYTIDRTRLLEDIINYMLTECYTGSGYKPIINSDSLKYFKNSTKYKYLVLAHLRDMLYDSNSTPPSHFHPAAIQWNFTFEILLSWLKDAMGIYWRIDNNVFKLLHFTELSYNLSEKDSHDLTNFKGINWTKNLKLENFTNTDKTNRYKRTSLNQLQEFIGNDIITSGIKDGITKTISLDAITTDIPAILINPTGFNGDSDVNFVLISCNFSDIESITIPDIINDITFGFKSIYRSINNFTFINNISWVKFANTGEVIGNMPLDINENYNLSFDYIGIYGKKLNVFLKGNRYNTSTKDELFAQEIRTNLSVNFNFRTLYDYNFATLYLEYYDDIDNNEFKINNVKLTKLTNNGILSGTSIISAGVFLNADLSIGNLDHFEFAPFNFHSATINGLVTEIAENKIAPVRENAKIECPVTDLLNQFSFDELLKINTGTNFRIKSIELKSGSGSFGNLMLTRYQKPALASPPTDGVAGVVADTWASIAWSAGENAIAYRIYHYTFLLQTVIMTNATLIGLTSATYYAIDVCSINSDLIESTKIHINFTTF